MEKGKELKSKVPQDQCPKCRGPMNHGECPRHGYCGCSWDPTSMNDYCKDHRPK